MRDRCRLCGSDAEIQRSHILPAFVFRWIRESSATGHIRLGEEPNRRVQDGWKKRWLCSSCENLIGAAERQFAQQVFKPVVEDRMDSVEYGPWLFKFCVSVSWRVLRLFQDSDQFDDYSRDDCELLDHAAITWRDYLLGHNADVPQAFRQHLYIVRGVSSAKHEVAPNLNRYVLRHIAADVVRSGHQHIVYAKLPRIFIMGVLRDECPNDWRGTEVHADGGIISHVQRVPDAFYDYVNEKAKRAGALLESISDRQKARMLADISSDPVRAGESDTLKALQWDIVLGLSARQKVPRVDAKWTCCGGRFPATLVQHR